jgi:hypothetical protein
MVSQYASSNVYTSHIDIGDDTAYIEGRVGVYIISEKDAEYLLEVFKNFNKLPVSKYRLDFLVNSYPDVYSRDKKLTEDDMQEVIKIDCDMPLSYITEGLIDSIDMLAPFGTGNTKPLFALKNVPVFKAAYMGKDGQYLRLTVGTENGGTMTALMFRNVPDFEKAIIEKYGDAAWQSLFSGKSQGVPMDIVYEPSINEYRGDRNVQIIIENFK